MSFLKFIKQGIFPSVGIASKGIVALDADRRLKLLDENGVVSSLTNNALFSRNILINGGIAIQQRVATANTAIPSVSTTTRAGQVADRWAVTTGNATTTSWAQIDAIGAPETGLSSRYYGKITQATNAAKFIFSQFIIAANVAPIRGSKVRISVNLKQFVGSVQTYKLGLLQLTRAGTVDVCPTFISAIGATGVNPTWGTNLSAIAPDSTPTGENGTINGSYLEITSNAQWTRSSAVFTIPTDCKNLCVVLIKDGTGGATDSVGITEVQMTEGTEIIDYVAPPLTEELLKCQRYYCKSFPLATVPAASLAVATAGNGEIGTINRAGATALASYINIRFPVRMWKVPTIILFTPVGAGAVPYRISGASPAVQTTAAQTGATDKGVVVSSTGDAAGVVGDLVGVHYVADAEFLT